MLPAGHEGEPAEFAVRAVSAVSLATRFRRSAVTLAGLFEADEVLRARLGRTNWYVGRSASWTRHVIGSRQLWADLDILPFGLSAHPTFYAMGGLPGAPPDVHRRARRTAVMAGFRHGPVDPSTVDESIAFAADLALGPDRRTLDVRRFARALFFQVNAVSVVGVSIDRARTVEILRWFDRWSALLSNPLALVGHSNLPFTPARRLLAVLTEWYEYLVEVLTGPPPAGQGLVAALRDQMKDGEVTLQEAAGYLATILFAGTEPPAHTLIWAHALCADAPVGSIGPLDPERAAALIWESFRVQPAVNVVVRRRSAGADRYESESSDVYVVFPPLTHQRSNTLRGEPLAFSPSHAGQTHFDPDEYPGLGSGAHYCIGARLGMDVGQQALAWLMNETTVVTAPDVRVTGVVTTEPRRLPVVAL